MLQFPKALAAILMFAVIGTGSAGFSGGADLEEVTATEAASSSASRLPSKVELVAGFADILRIDGDISTILLGDPDIADASPVDSGTILLNGQAAGTTNMIVLDESGDILANLMLHVISRQPGTVTVRRALKPQIYSCGSGLCESGGPFGAEEASPATAPAVAPSNP
ncbi:MAG: pilus assembly protein N-terminal domain-containing protein [Limimaricola soesokkakensis]|uniref:pilus assembly protein N-terminal domain-containing protein n=1 Tax=Limimaricola soesokkakensis TaxID=1343159 RepID=UPI0040597B67